MKFEEIIRNKEKEKEYVERKIQKESLKCDAKSKWGPLLLLSETDTWMDSDLLKIKGFSMFEVDAASQFRSYLGWKSFLYLPAVPGLQS